MSNEELTQVKLPFNAVPKVFRWLSVMRKGKRIRLSAGHLFVYNYLMEMPEMYKTTRNIGRELGISPNSYQKYRDDLLEPCIETGEPLVYKSKFKDSQNQNRVLLQIYPCHSSLAAYWEYLFDEEQGQNRREQWLREAENGFEGGVSKSDTPMGGVSKSDTRAYQNLTSPSLYIRENKEKETNNMTRGARDDAVSEKNKVKKSPASEGKKSKRSSKKPIVQLPPLSFGCSKGKPIPLPALEEVDISTLKLTDEEMDLAQKLLDECREVVIAAANPKGFVYAAVKDGYASSMIEKAKSREVEFEAINKLHERYKKRYESLNDPSILHKGYMVRSRKGVILVKGELRKSFSISTADEFKQLVRRTYGKDLF